MLYVYSANIRPGHWEKLSEWLERNKGPFAAAQPKLWKFRDAYFTVFGLGQANVELHWEIEEYRAFDEARAAAHQKGDYHRLLTELHGFLDPASGHGRLLSTIERGANLAPGRVATIVGC